MSATTISLDQWIEDFRREVGGCAEDARGDTKEFDRIVQDKVARELHSEEEKRRSSQDPRYQPTYSREAGS
jgi:hypothetical protein